MSGPTPHPWPAYQWPGGQRSAFCFTVDVDETGPYLWGQRAPDAARRLGQLELRRFGQRTGVWRLMDLLERFGIKGTFFVPGAIAEANPGLLPALLQRGHQAGLHGWFHELVADSTDSEFTGALEASIDLFRRQTGAAPQGFRSPAWEMTPHMLAELARLGLWDSSLMGADHPYEIAGVTEVPVQWAMDDAILYKFSALPGDRTPVAPGAVLESWTEEWEGQQQYGGLTMLTVHDWISSRVQRLRVLEKLLERVTAAPDCWVTTVGEVAAWHEASANAGRFIAETAIPEGVESRRFR